MVPSLSKAGAAILAAGFSVFALSAADQSKTGQEAVIKHVDPKQAKSLIDQKKVVVLDIRTPEEFKSGSIPGATNVNFRSPDFEKQISALDKSNAYLVHCAAGTRSTASLPAFKKLQFKSIYHLDGGIAAWKKAGLPVETPKAP